MTSRPLWLPTFAAALASCRIPASTSSLFSIPRSYAALILVQASPSPPLHLESCHRNFVSAFAKEVGPGPELVSFPSIATQCAGGRYGTGDPNLLLKLSPRLPPLAPFNNNKIHWTSMCRIGVIKQPCAYCHARPALKRIQVQIAGNGGTPIVLSCLQKTQVLILSSHYIHELTTEAWIWQIWIAVESESTFELEQVFFPKNACMDTGCMIRNTSSFRAQFPRDKTDNLERDKENWKGRTEAKADNKLVIQVVVPGAFCNCCSLPQAAVVLCEERWYVPATYSRRGAVQPRLTRSFLCVFSWNGKLRGRWSQLQSPPQGRNSPFWTPEDTGIPDPCRDRCRRPDLLRQSLHVCRECKIFRQLFGAIEGSMAVSSLHVLSTFPWLVSYQTSLVYFSGKMSSN